MGNYEAGQCIPLLDHEETIVFCDIVSYQGSGNYHVMLTRQGVVHTQPKKFPNLSIIHESVIEEFKIEV